MPTLLITLALTGCNVRDPQADLQSFKSCDALEKTLKDQAIEEIRWAHSWGAGGIGFVGGGAAGGGERRCGRQRLW